MPITLSYDLSAANTNDRNYVRSALERFHWRRLGGSVFRYDGVDDEGVRREDWLNHVIPAMMFFRSFLLKKGIALTSLTIDASSVALVDCKDAYDPFGTGPMDGSNVVLAQPTNHQSSEATLRAFIDACTEAATK